jgi:alkanesulfonate monooxygenase SsuD/methylene tetrahydromethanopterin reductase-like flavin-dependent oxidoreductase (luciferase family)
MHSDHSVQRATHPLLNDDNAFKLGVFGVNVLKGCSMTSAEGTIEVEWPESLTVAQAADRAGLDAMIPIARWRGFGDRDSFNDRSFETFTWAAALGALTERIGVVATVHVPTAHPVRVAKEAVTVDHISRGRLGLNVVAGWNQLELDMFGIELTEHDERYDVADEWIDFATRLWTEERFDYAGRYFQSTGAHSNPHPVQTPRPLVMSAGASGRGGLFAARHADVNFIMAADLPAHRAKCEQVRAIARERFGRELKLMGMAYVVCADTEAEARRYFDYYVHEKGDWDGALQSTGHADGSFQSMDFRADQAMINGIAGAAGQPLIGTPEQIVEGMLEMQAVGLDGVTLSWVRYADGIAQYEEVLLPLLIDAGLRCPVPTDSSAVRSPSGVEARSAGPAAPAPGML